MNEITNSNLDKRIGFLKSKLGELAYERREHAIAIEGIDLQVTQMESQGVVLEATKKDIQLDERDEIGRQEAEKAHAKEERSKRATDAAKKRKGKTTKATPREGKAATKA